MDSHSTTDLGGGRLRALWRDVAPVQARRALGRIEA